VKIVQNGDQQCQPSKAVKVDAQNGDQQWPPSKIVMAQCQPSKMDVIPPLMSLTLARKEKRRKRTKTRKVMKKKKQNDLRLLLDEKNTQKQSENFVFCTKDILL
jgi:hypothetical protein